MENELLKRLVAIVARFDQGILDAPGNVGIDKPAIREAKLNGIPMIDFGGEARKTHQSYY